MANKPTSIFTFLNPESSLIPGILCDLQNFTAIFCKCCRMSSWIVIIKFQIFSQASDFLNRFFCWFWQDISTFITVYISFSCRRNVETLFLHEILCSVEPFFPEIHPMSLCAPWSKIMSSLKVLSKLRFLSYRKNKWCVSFPKIPSFNEIIKFVKLIDPITITNKIPG